MNATILSDGCGASPLDIVDFKWLMAHEGHAVNVERLKADRAYAVDCLARADASATPALRRVAAVLRGALLQP